MVIPQSFYLDQNVQSLAAQLLGKVLITDFDNHRTSGIIVETEAYCGISDDACHAYPMKRTKRTEPIFGMGGMSYIYLIYGMYHCFNVVGEYEDSPKAVLIRAVEPICGEEIMKQRRGTTKRTLLTSGPGRLSQAMGINLRQNNMTLFESSTVWIEDQGIKFENDRIKSSRRIGLNKKLNSYQYPWRYYIVGNKCVSKLK